MSERLYRQLAAGATEFNFNIRVVVFLIISVFFFATALLASFFAVTLVINQYGLGDIGPGLFMVGLVPPSVATVLLFTKVLGRALWPAG